MLSVPVKIDVSDSIIRISGTGSLLPRHLSHLSLLWQFKRQQVGSELLLLTNDVDVELLFELVEYFKGEGVDYEMSNSAIKRHHDATYLREVLDGKREDGARFKDGNFDHEEFREFQEFLRSKLSRILRSHQVKAAYHLYSVCHGANFSVPGSGKTSVVLSTYEKLRYEGKANFLFVVGPPSSFGPWTNEFKDTLGRSPNTIVVAGGDKALRKKQYLRPPNPTDELFLTTFQSMAKDVREIKALFNFAGAKPFLVIDEAHYIKQIDGVWSKAALDISTSATIRCVLTGTPLPNSFTDVFNLFDFLWGRDKILNITEKSQIELNEEDNIEEAKNALRKSISPFYYRVRKKDLGLEEQVFHEPYRIPMNGAEEKLYSAIVTRIREYTREDYLRNIELVNRLRRGRMMRLRQSFSYAKMLASVLEGYDEGLIDNDSDLAEIIRNYDLIEIPAKLEFLINLISEFQSRKEKVVIWSNFVATVDLISNALTARNIKNKCILGRTPRGAADELSDESKLTLKDVETRENIRREFIDPDSGLNVLIANPAACAESISLHKTCHNAVYYDLTYNCAQYLQSLDRIHRVGGSEAKKVHYHFLQYENTVEESIKNILDTKAQRMLEVIEDDFQIYSLDMSQDDEELTIYRKLFGANE